MKFQYSSIFLLCALQSTSAFVAQGPKAVNTVAFSSKGSNVDYTRSKSTGRTAPAKNTAELEARLIATQKALEDRLRALDAKAGRRPSPRKTADGEIVVQGGSLKTWTFPSPRVERVQVVLGTEGRPLDADIALWQGPDNTPQKMRVYVEDGNLRPFNAVMATPRGPNTVAIRNTGHLEFPMSAAVVAEVPEGADVVSSWVPNDISTRKVIQGGALRTYPFDPSVESVRVLLNTDGRPLNARVELLQGPNNNKQVIELYSEDGRDRPFFMVVETPGSGNVVRVVNTATIEFPMAAWVEADRMGSPEAAYEAVIGGDSDGGFISDREWFSSDNLW